MTTYAPLKLLLTRVLMAVPITDATHRLRAGQGAANYAAMEYVKWERQNAANETVLNRLSIANALLDASVDMTPMAR